MKIEEVRELLQREFIQVTEEELQKYKKNKIFNKYIASEYLYYRYKELNKLTLKFEISDIEVFLSSNNCLVRFRDEEFEEYTFIFSDLPITIKIQNKNDNIS